MEPFTDWALNEECNQYDECGGYRRVHRREQGGFPGGVPQLRSHRRLDLPSEQRGKLMTGS